MTALLCFSHLSWNFVYQRPQHLMSRLAKKYQVYYIEEPRPGNQYFYQTEKIDSLTVVRLFFNEAEGYNNERLATLVNKFIKEQQITAYDAWYYTPMALAFTKDLQPERVIYDCMDELANFRFAPPELLKLEDELFQHTDLVFTGGHTLYEAKKHRHHNIYPFPSSIDKAHFEQARIGLQDPADQSAIPKPRFGFYGVVDERFDTRLIAEAAALRPDWQFVIIGPIVKISEDELPKAQNIHYLGGKTYNELPVYISNWQVALIPFAINKSTEFISPTKTPEYLAGGLPVISTPIKDVVTPYGREGLVSIVNNAEEFVKAGEEILSNHQKKEWLEKVDVFLADNSWDRTFSRMVDLIDNINN